MAPDQDIQIPALGGGYRHGERKGGPKRESRKPRLSARSRALSSPTASIALDLVVGGRAPPHNGGSRGVRGHADREIAFSVSRTVVFVVNLREDVERRKAVRQEVAMLSPLQCAGRLAFHGASLVRRVDPGRNSCTCRLQLTDDAAARFGAASVLQRSKVPRQAPAICGVQ